ncbi:hypothetical protein J1614_009181 [Plenodomus biglobosus]|nr:hypothetical protein J1614_009181 [Plenodomus biglobosus]
MPHVEVPATRLTFTNPPPSASNSQLQHSTAQHSTAQPHSQPSPNLPPFLPLHSPLPTPHHIAAVPMGNLCGKESKSDNFDGQGRTLGSAPAPATKASVPSNVAQSKPKVGGPPRTLGEGNSRDDPKAAAAAAAEVCSFVSLESESEGWKGGQKKSRTGQPQPMPVRACI